MEYSYIPTICSIICIHSFFLWIAVPAGFDVIVATLTSYPLINRALSFFKISAEASIPFISIVSFAAACFIDFIVLSCTFMYQICSWIKDKMTAGNSDNLEAEFVNIEKNDEEVMGFLYPEDKSFWVSQKQREHIKKENTNAIRKAKKLAYTAKEKKRTESAIKDLHDSEPLDENEIIKNYLTSANKNVTSEAAYKELIGNLQKIHLKELKAKEHRTAEDEFDFELYSKQFRQKGITTSKDSPSFFRKNKNNLTRTAENYFELKKNTL